MFLWDRIRAFGPLGVAVRRAPNSNNTPFFGALAFALDQGSGKIAVTRTSAGMLASPEVCIR